MPKSKNSSYLDYLGIGALVYLGGLFWYSRSYSKEPLSNTHETIENNAKPPPKIRVPENGNGLYGYFRTFWDPTIHHDPYHI